MWLEHKEREDREEDSPLSHLIDTELMDIDLPVQSVLLSPNMSIRHRKKMLRTLSSLSISTTTSDNNDNNENTAEEEVMSEDDGQASSDDDSLSPLPPLRRPKALSASILGTYDQFSNLRRRRSVSSPRDIDSMFFQNEIDFHSDVYDDTTPDELYIIEDDSMLADDTVACESSPSDNSVRTCSSIHNTSSNTLRNRKRALSLNRLGDKPLNGTISPRIIQISPRNSASSTVSISGGKKGTDIKQVSVDSNSSPTEKSRIIQDILIFMISGILSSITYEMLLKINSGTALVSSFFLHLYIVLFSMSKAPVYLFSSRIPMIKHFAIVLLSFSFIYFKSMAIPLLPMPVFIVSTNLQLVVGLLVGKYIFGKSFMTLQYLGVGFITIGCVMITFVSNSSSNHDIVSNGWSMAMGLFYMSLSLTSISIMIPIGSKYVQKYDADVQEHIFIQHFLALPLFLLQWESKIYPILKNIISVSSDSCYDDESSRDLEEGFHGFSIPLIGTTYHVFIPLLLLCLLSTTFFAQINRHYMIQVSISTSSLLAQLIGTFTKTIVFLISSLYFNSPPYPPLATWIGLCVQVVGSYIYVQASFSSENNTEEGFRPNTNTNRLTRVSWSGDALYDSNLLGLSAHDIASIRKATNKHNNRILLNDKRNVKFNCDSYKTDVGDGSTLENPPLSLNVQRTVSEVVLPPQQSDAGDNLMPLPVVRKRGKSTDDKFL